MIKWEEFYEKLKRELPESEEKRVILWIVKDYKITDLKDLSVKLFFARRLLLTAENLSEKDSAEKTKLLQAKITEKQLLAADLLLIKTYENVLLQDREEEERRLMHVAFKDIVRKNLPKTFPYRNFLLKYLEEAEITDFALLVKALESVLVAMRERGVSFIKDYNLTDEQLEELIKLIKKNQKYFEYSA